MLLNQLFITDQIKCSFHPGFNIILGKNRIKAPTDSPDEENFSDTNGLGKTLIILAMKYVLSGDTGGVFASEHFAQKKHWALLEVKIENDFKVLMRPLWYPLGDGFFITFDGALENCRKALDSHGINLNAVTDAATLEARLKNLSGFSVLNRNEYQKYINKLENIDYSRANMTFSSLLDFMIRDEKDGFSDPISRVARTQWVQYRAAQYLFGLPAFIEEEVSKTQDDIASLNNALEAKRKELSAKSITSVDKIENLKMQTFRKLEKIKTEIDAVNIAPALEDVRKKYSEKRTELFEVNSAINQKESYSINYQKNLEDIDSRASALAELLKVDEFYQDLLGFFPDQVKANVQKYSEFFNSVSTDRRGYYESLITTLKGELKILRSNKKEIEQELERLSYQFKSTSLVRDIATLTSQEEELKTEITNLDRLKNVLIECENLESEIEALETKKKEKIDQGKALEKRGRSKRAEMIKLFQELVVEIYKTQDGILEFDYKHDFSSSIAGRTEILCSIPSQGSHGRTYGKINIFDFVWFLRNRAADEFNPQFLIHDGSYVKISKEVKPAMLQAILKRLPESKQYFITLNEGELENLKDYEKYVCCTLDGSTVTGKFFKEQFG